MTQQHPAALPGEPDLVIRGAVPDDHEVLHDLLFASWMTTWAPACPSEAVAEFREQGPVAGYLTACLEQIDVGVSDGRAVAAMHLRGDHLPPCMSRRD